MLLSGSQVINTPVMSLQTGKELARIEHPVINPHTLGVIAYSVTGQHLDANPSFLRVVDIREMGSLGIIIDSSDEFVEPDDIIADKAIYEIAYALEGKHVIDDHQKKIGKVIEYTLDIDSFVIEQLVVKKPLLQSFKDDEVLIARAQIIEVNDTAIIVKSGRIPTRAASSPSRHYVNPFRQSSPQTETTDTGGH